ncbi:hypothetical protein NA655_13940 [Pseudomonas kuykendallii]|uniref:Amino acid transport protein n=1 Tax=Pseudomonas kuykendallii TaxID=1007099 RepID=A0A1H2T8J9_9PSED|nr:hypothetical protein [Pseudomonas kuykendallii]MCQ4272125.1 hypothetical protein [Pseudomonas kuykendallii]SDW40276.1 hypothetical protein SAMN05216287_0910 [Pseudomonas kuykendallii]
MDTASLLWGLLFSAFGFAYFVYGKKQGKAVPLLCGIALMVFPYFVDSDLLLAGIGLTLLAVPLVVRG